MGSITWEYTKSSHYYWIHIVSEDRSLAWLSLERFYQQLTESNADIYRQPLDLGQGPIWKSKRKDWRSWKGLQPHRKNNSVVHIFVHTTLCSWLVTHTHIPPEASLDSQLAWICRWNTHTQLVIFKMPFSSISEHFQVFCGSNSTLNLLPDCFFAAHCSYCPRHF